MSRQRNESFSSTFHASAGFGRPDSLSHSDNFSAGGEPGARTNGNIGGPAAETIVPSFSHFRTTVVNSAVNSWAPNSVNQLTAFYDKGTTTNSHQSPHYGVIDSLIEEYFPELDELMNMAAPSNGNGNGNVASSSWKTSFMMTRERFSSPVANPIQLKLGGKLAPQSGRKWASSSPPQIMTTSDDWSSFEKLFGERHPGVGTARSAATTSRPSLTPSPTPAGISHPVQIPNHVDPTTAREIETRFVALNDLIKGITFLGTNGVASGNSDCTGPPVQTGAVSPRNRNASPAATIQTQKLLSVQKSSFVNNSLQTNKSPLNVNNMAQTAQRNNFQPASNANGNVSHIGGPIHTVTGAPSKARRVPDLVLPRDPNPDMINSVDSLIDEIKVAIDPSDSNSSMALKIIDEVQQFLQTNTDTLKKSGRFPQALHSPVTPTSPTNKSFSNLSDQLTRQVVDERYPSTAPLSPSASSVVRRAMLDYHHLHHQRTTTSSLPRVNHVHVSTGSVAERVNQFEHNRDIKRSTGPVGPSMIGKSRNNGTYGANENRPSSVFHFQLPNSVAGVSASIIHQPVVTTAASSSAKFVQNGDSAAPAYQHRPTEKDTRNSGSVESRNEEGKDEKRNRAAVLSEIEKALQGLPTGTSASTTTPAASSPKASPSVNNDKNLQKSAAQAAIVVNNVNIENSAPAASKGTVAQNGRAVVGVSLRSLLNRQASSSSTNETAESIINSTSAVFRTLPGGKAELADFGRICRACNLPGCLKQALFNKCCGGKKTFAVQLDLTRFWTSLAEEAGDKAVVLVRLLSLSASKRYLVPEDFLETVQCVVDDHPGLAFLREAPEFHSRYVQTVIARIFFSVNRTWSGRLTAAEIRRSNLIEVLHRIDDEEDINRITDYFSYEHFYVIYCKFWELDRDHDLLIDKEDLSRFDDYALSRRAIDRVFSPAINNDRKSLEDGKMTYPQFVRFILSEKDKKHPTSIEYWFRCMDLDGDGVISIYELQHFYDEQAEKMILCGIEPMPFVDILCQVMDMVRPQIHLKITLADLKHCKMAPVFFDTFLNLHRYLEHEQMESAGGVNAALKNGERENDETALNDWNMYAAEEYEALVAEEADLGTEIKCDSDEDER